MTIVYPIYQNPTLFLDGTTLVEPPNTIDFTTDIIKPIFNPLGIQVPYSIPVFNPQDNVNIPFPVASSNIAALVKIGANPDDSLGALQCAFGHPSIGNEDVIYVVPPTANTNWTFILFSPSLRDRFRIFNSSRSSFNVEILLVDAVRVLRPDTPVSFSGSGGAALAKEIVNAIIQNNWENFGMPPGGLKIVYPFVGPQKSP